MKVLIGASFLGILRLGEIDVVRELTGDSNMVGELASVIACDSIDRVSERVASSSRWRSQ